MDRRDRNHNWWGNFDERSMTVTTRYAEIETDDEGNEIGEVERFPVKYEVCGTCDGKGRHVNPNIDRRGLTAEDFDVDPDFYGDYMSGMYDVRCNECNGERVAIVLDEERATPAQVKWVQDWYQEEYSDRMTRWYENGCPE